ncbi:MAG: phosphoribosylglycinamide formyltransferase [Candidatus Wallbacteria bacterium GWC2_49_35]|uniref:Phosphoribosylglycinamide formyltransferase n=1 Tax=Candidatus Wallbacteria bacterium GWC2_49_35 TaxID=1817813 RepID=A0A1F7X0D9_9BACT|nr:MAG: phosphoribosylglycinamide formyltransferase [Candidatus Wallbacteria bacterium GWC2_49_35]HBC74753.1 phosphoribosylglycinamide formyltransferase [Candidatus Wallbacteria bacterium]
MKKRIVILISGRGSNMAAIAASAKSGILSDCCIVTAVVSNRSEAPGLELAGKSGIPAVVVESSGISGIEFDRKLTKAVEIFSPDYIILAGFMKVLGPVFISRFTGKIINIHPADTKLHRGLGGYEWAFKKRLGTTKVTVHFVDEGLDTGEILGQREVDLRGADTLEEVERRGLAAEHEFFSEILRKIFAGRDSNANEWSDIKCAE